MVRVESHRALPEGRVRVPTVKGPSAGMDKVECVTSNKPRSPAVNVAQYNASVRLGVLPNHFAYDVLKPL